MPFSSVRPLARLCRISDDSGFRIPTVSTLSKSLRQRFSATVDQSMSPFAPRKWRYFRGVKGDNIPQTIFTLIKTT